MADVTAAAAELEALLAAHQGAGLYTHAFAATGRLGEPAPRLTAALLPGGRDVFDLASLTKALATTPLVFAAIRRGETGLDGTVAGWLGDARTRDLGLSPRLAGLSVRSLLRHESGLPAWRNFWVCHLGVEADAALADPGARQRRLVEGLNRAAGASLAEDQGAVTPRQVYSDLGFLLLGLCLEAKAGERLDASFAEFCRADLGTEASSLPLGYGPTLASEREDFARRAVPTAVCPVRRRLLSGEAHDENCAALGGVAGHAGLFGTGEGVVAYLTALAGAPVGQELLAANAAARPEPAALPDLSQDALCGWRLGNGPSTAPFGAGRAIGHPGFTGVAFWLCPETQAYAVFLTNRVASGRTTTLAAIASLRRDVFTQLAAVHKLSTGPTT